MKKTASNKTMKKKAWNVFSQYIRTRDCILTTGLFDRGRCVTCGKIFPIQELQAGHAIGGRYNAILFDEELVNAQCRGCNGYGNGKYAEYSVWFINRYGLERWQEKIALSHRVVKLDYQEVYNIYKLKLEELKNEGSIQWCGV